MLGFYQRYLEYRRIGFNRLDAGRFAWLMLEPARIRRGTRR